MADMKIEEATLADSIAGTDVVPAAVGTTPAPRKVSIAQIGSFVIDALAALTGETSIPIDFSVFISKSNSTGDDSVTKITPALLGEEIAIILFDNAASTLSGTDKVIIQSASGTTTTRRTTTISDILYYVKNNIGDVMNIAGLTTAEDLRITDEIPIHVLGETTNNKTTLDAIESNIIESIPGRTIDVLSEISNTDSIIFSRNGVLNKVLLQNSGITKGGAIAPASTSQNKIPQWSATQKKLNDGLSVQTALRSEGEADDASIATEKAVRTAVNTRVEKPQSITGNNIPQWDGTSGKLKNGFSIGNYVRPLSSADEHTIVDEYAIRRAINQRCYDYTGYGQFGTITSISDLPTTGIEDGEQLIATVVQGSNSYRALFVYVSVASSWFFVNWLQDSIPTHS